MYTHDSVVGVHGCICENACENPRLTLGVIQSHFLSFLLTELRTWASLADQHVLKLQNTELYHTNMVFNAF